MKRIVINTRSGNDGSLHLDLPAGSAAPNFEVQVTIEPLLGNAKQSLTASDLLQSGLVGIWAGRTDIPEGHEFARRLRDQAQSRGRVT